MSGDDISRVGVGMPNMWRLCVQERRLSGLRRRLHERIDSQPVGVDLGRFERNVSVERQELHQLIALLGGRFERR